ncbi:MAG TPA: hypothetical protein PL069_01310 [Saprospiraceae bacterium]|nr:hypothetical protein [Saprospiraceae bacterium]
MIPAIPGYSVEAWKSFVFNPGRLRRMQEGAGIILDFLQLVLGQGLLASELLSEDNLKELSTRLVDTQIPGAARKIKSFARYELNPETLPMFRFELRYLGNLAHMLMGFEQLSLSAKLQVWQICGGLISKELVLNQPGVNDRWVTKSVVVAREDGLVTRKTWFYGTHTLMWAFTLDYSFGTQPLPEGNKVGDTFNGIAKFYPGLLPGRILFTEKAEDSGVYRTPDVMRFEDIARLKLGVARLAAHDPLFHEYPVLMDKIILTSNNGQFYLVDVNNEFLPLITVEKRGYGSKDDAWERFADAGGHPVSLWIMVSQGQFILI